eukprot:scaffold19.g1771.t1
MQTPAPAAWQAAEGREQSEGFTPGVSVAAAQAGGDTPRLPSPQEQPSEAVPGAGSAAAASAAALSRTAAAAAAADQPAAPLSKPTLRVQGGDIILEETAASPQHRSTAGGGDETFASRGPTRSLSTLEPGASGGRHAAAAAAAAALAGADAPGGPAFSRQTTGDTGRAAAAGSRPTTFQNLNLSADAGGGEAGPRPPGMNGGDAPHNHHHHHHHHSQHRHHEGEGGAGSSSEAVAASRAKYRTSLTEENVAYQNKLAQYSGRVDPAERMWRWLEEAGPPYDVQPSLGVPPPPPRQASGSVPAGKRHAGRRRRFWCGCFG